MKKFLTKSCCIGKRKYTVNINEQTTDELIKLMQKNNLQKGYILFQGKNPKTSHPIFKPIQQKILEKNYKDFTEHEAIFLKIGEKSNHLFTTSLQKSYRGQPSGGVRLWKYDTVDTIIRDGLRLSTGMGRKSALAGIWWGGGKGIVAEKPGVNYKDLALRKRIFNDYGTFITELKGAYIAAEDVGLTVADTGLIFETSRFVTCIPKEFGGSGNPSELTGFGTVNAMEAAVDFLSPGDTLAGKRVVIQGSGNVARYIISDLISRGVGSILASDINKDSIEMAKTVFSEQVTSGQVEFQLKQRGDNSILQEKCDILAPSALGGILTTSTIPTIKAKIICGAANNQLLEGMAEDVLLKEMGILYVPDFLNNRMGIVNCANEQYGSIPNDSAIYRHFSKEYEHSIWNVTQKVCAKSKDENIGTDQAAKLIADVQANMEHPIWGNRTRKIIASVIENWKN